MRVTLRARGPVNEGINRGGGNKKETKEWCLWVKGVYRDQCSEAKIYGTSADTNKEFTYHKCENQSHKDPSEASCMYLVVITMK